MEVHKPKPVHDWREFGKEVGIIVLGVVIALAGEQIVDSLHWVYKAHGAEAASRQELAEDLSYAQEQHDLNPCANRYFDALQTAITQNRPDVVQKLYKLGAPLDGHPWRADSWAAAVNGQVSNHLPAERVSAYSVAFRFAVAERDSQWDMIDLYGQAMTGRFGHLQDPGVVNDQLKAVDRLRAKEAQRLDISDTMLEVVPKALQITALQGRAEEFRNRVQACEAGLRAISPT